MTAVCLLFSENPRFVEALKDLESSPIYTISCLLMLPMQRITRLLLLIRAIFSRLDGENSAEYEPCQEALNIIDRVRLNQSYQIVFTKVAKMFQKNAKIRILTEK